MLRTSGWPEVLSASIAIRFLIRRFTLLGFGKDLTVLEKSADGIIDVEETDGYVYAAWMVESVN